MEFHHFGKKVCNNFCYKNCKVMANIFKLLKAILTTNQAVQCPCCKIDVISNSPSQEYIHQDDRTLLNCDITPGFKPFTSINVLAVSTIRRSKKVNTNKKATCTKPYFELFLHPCTGTFHRNFSCTHAHS